MEQRKIERRRKAILNIFLTHIEDGELRLLETIKTIDIYGRPVQFNVVRMQHFLDPITESFEEHTLSCKMLDGTNVRFVRFRELSLEALLEVVRLTIEDKITLYSNIDDILHSKEIGELKAALLSSGLLGNSEP